MKRIINLGLSFLLIVLSFSICKSQHSSDAWETRLNRIQPPAKVLKTAGIEKGMIVGEIGAGRGRYAVKIAERVGDQGKVYANDIDEADLNYLNQRCKRDGVSNIETVVGGMHDPDFPVNNLDMLFLINTYHHLDDGLKLMKNAVRYLKPDGKLVIVEADPAKQDYPDPDECTEPCTLVLNMTKAGFVFEGIEKYLKRDNIYIFSVANKKP